MFKKFLLFVAIVLIILSGVYVSKEYINKDYNLRNEVAIEIEENKVNIANVVEKDNNEVSINQVEDNTSINEEQEEVSEEIFSKYYKKAEELMEDMTLEEKVGQMFLARYPEKGVIDEIKNYNPGGYILFSRDFDNETPKTILKELNNNQSASKINLILGVDEEGGTVVRVSNHKAFRNTKFLSPQQLWNRGGLQEILKDSKEKSKLLKSIGLNMNLAPVVDVPQKETSFIFDRSYGRGAEKTGIYTEELIKTMNESNMISVMKHFPGYGDNVDTHTGIAIDNKKYKSFEEVDFIPFKKGIDAGAPCILVSHNIVKCIDKEKPTSLSKNTMKILREELNFSGIIMTDDLAMDAVKSYVENGEAAVQAVLAGNDMIISSDFVKQKKEILSAIKKGKISEQTIDTAVRRILAFKYAYGII